MPVRTWWCLSLGARSAEGGRARFVPLVRHGLGLSAAEAARLWEALPRELLLADLDERARAYLLERLPGAGVAAAAEPLAAAAEPCPRHPRLAARDACAGCGERPACFVCRELARPPGCDACARRARRRALFRRGRIAALLAVLVVVALGAWRDRRRVVSWRVPLVVGVHPIDADGAPETEEYVRGLREEDFARVAAFLEREARRHGVPTRPLVRFVLAPPLAARPPPPPAERDPLRVALWSLRLRLWAFRAGRASGVPAQVRIFALYHAPRPGVTLEHSLALERGHLAIAHLLAGADEAPANDVVIAHELLHTAGATDKYDADGTPRFPDGYAEPARDPLHPQARAELMGGRIPVSGSESRMAESLDDCLVGPVTAAEVGWTRPAPGRSF